MDEEGDKAAANHIVQEAGERFKVENRSGNAQEEGGEGAEVGYDLKHVSWTLVRNGGDRSIERGSREVRHENVNIGKKMEILKRRLLGCCELMNPGRLDGGGGIALAGLEAC